MIQQSLFAQSTQISKFDKQEIVEIEGYPNAFMVTTPDMEFSDGFKMERGFANGYVILHRGHPYFGVEYDDIPVEVHGGLTFSEPDEVYDTWIVGFDTAHVDDNKLTCNRACCEAETIKLYFQLYK
jgi:hypothetical protein